MGCCFGKQQVSDDAKTKLLDDMEMDIDEKESKLDQPLSNIPKRTDDELPEMSVNRLAAQSMTASPRVGGNNNYNNNTFTTSNNREIGGRRGNAAKPSPLNSFPKSQKKELYGPSTSQDINIEDNNDDDNNNNNNNNNNNMDINNNINIDDVNKGNNNKNIDILPEENEIIDEQGDVHVNRYYNETRNANLSITSKYSDLSHKPINPNIDNTLNVNKSSLGSNTTFASNLMSNVTDDTIESRQSNASKLLWDDDFSEKHTVTSAKNTANV